MRASTAVILLSSFVLACNGDPTDAPDGSTPRLDSGQPDAATTDTGRDVQRPDVGKPDLGPSLDVGSDASDTGPEPDPFEPPARILFIGNSFTLGGPIPSLVDQLANSVGWPDPDVTMSAFGGETLEGHRGRLDETVAAVDQGNWDVVVLQEFSTRPTDNIGDPAQFKEDATWFHDRIKQSSPDARVVLYETWARHPDHSFFPGSFATPEEMQAQLRTHYNDAATNAIPAMATVPVDPPIDVAPAGDAWEHHLAQPDAVRLHGDDDYHAGSNGQYLNAVVIYSTIYHRAAAGLPALGRDAAAVAALQRDADATTGETTTGGPPPSGNEGLQPGQRVFVDFAEPAAVGDGWTTLAGDAVFNVIDTTNTATEVDVAVGGFLGANTNGLPNNGLGWPADATGDALYCGSFDGHAEGLANPGQVTLRGLQPGAEYDLRLFASRAGDDGGMGRLTRYTVDGSSVDVDASSNTADTADFVATADATGAIVIDVAVSPDGEARFCYIGALELTGR